MTFIKNHLISLLSGLFGIVFITLAVLTINSNAVAAKMANVKKNTNADSIRSLATNPKNQKIIDEEIKRGDSAKKEADKALKEAGDFNKRSPLTGGTGAAVFPKPT